MKRKYKTGLMLIIIVGVLAVVAVPSLTEPYHTVECSVLIRKQIVNHEYIKMFSCVNKGSCQDYKPFAFWDEECYLCGIGELNMDIGNFNAHVPYEVGINTESTWVVKDCIADGTYDLSLTLVGEDGQPISFDQIPNYEVK